MGRSLCLVFFLICVGFDVCVSQSSVTIHFNTTTLTVDEGRIIKIQLVAQGIFDKNFTVNLTFTDGTARYPIDYAYNPRITPSVTFTPGSITSSVFRVNATSNNKWEGTKSFKVGFVLPPCPNLNSGRPDTLRVNIVDDDSVHVSFENSSLTVREDSGSVQLQLQSRGLYGRRFSVSFRCIEVFPVEAEDGEDFTGGVYTVEFQTLGKKRTVSSVVEVPIVNNSISEPTESFICIILRPRGADGIVVEDFNTITVVIEDDDSLKLSFEKAVYSGDEGGILSDIRLKAMHFGSPFSVQIFATTLDARRPEKENEAISGVDYTNPRSLPGRGVVQFNPASGPLSTSLSIPLLLDNITECTEYFGLSFVAITNVDELGIIMAVEPTMAIVAINDTNVPVVSFVESNVTGGEGDVVKLRVKRTGSIRRKLRCKVRIESTTAEKGVDYRVMTKSVPFKKLNVDSEVKTVRVKLLTGNANCFRVVLECKPLVLIGCDKLSATVCIQGN